MAKRKSTGKRQRFEIFKRDGFKCAYCGRSPPDVLLHVDHIEPVANGGSNDPTNLITACADCNGGKAAVPLTSVAPSLERQAAEAKERAEQVRAYSALLTELRQEKEHEAESLFRAFSDTLEWPVNAPPGTHLVITAEYRASLLRFMERLPSAEIINAIQIAQLAALRNPSRLGVTVRLDADGSGKGTVDGVDRRWRYLCGICWNMISDRDGTDREEMRRQAWRRRRHA